MEAASGQHRVGIVAAAAVLACLPLAGCSQVTATRSNWAKAADKDLTEIARHEEFRPMAVDHADFPDSHNPEALRKMRPTTRGGRLLRSELLSEGAVVAAVQQNGWPDAVELEDAWNRTVPHRFALFYQTPPRTVICGTAEASPSGEYCETLDFVPFAVRRLAFGAEPQPGPWPATIGEPYSYMLHRPAVVVHNPPPAPLDGPAFAAYADAERKEYEMLSEDMEQQRASTAFARLVPVAHTAGLEWRLVVVRATRPLAFGEPDGTIFVSDELVRRVDDGELVALLAHVMGHERYGHDRNCWNTLNTSKKTALVAGSVVGTSAAIGWDAAFLFICLVGGGNCPNVFLDPSAVAPAVTDYYCPVVPPRPESRPASVLVREREFQANDVAVAYLHKIGIPPGVLFDAIVKLSLAGPEPAEGDFGGALGGTPNGPDGSPEFAQMHYARQSAADLGRLLDAGLIPPAAPSTAQEPSAVGHTPTVGGAVQRYGKGRFLWWQGVCEDTSMISVLSSSTAPVDGVLTITPTSIVFERTDGAGTMIPFSEIKSVTVGSGFVRYGMIFVQTTSDSCNSFVASPLNLHDANAAGALMQMFLNESRNATEAAAVDPHPADLHTP